jgi:hypothetical protein
MVAALVEEPVAAVGGGAIKAEPPTLRLSLLLLLEGLKER